MNHCVPNFDMDEEFNDLPPTASSSGSARHNSKKSAMAEEDIMELLWQNGQVVMHTQNQRSFQKSNMDAAAIPAGQPVIRPSGEGTAAAANQHVFMEEDEMASWLHYPLHEEHAFDGRDLYSDLLYPPAASCAPVSAAVHPAADEIRQPPIQARPDPRAKCAEIQDAPPRIQNFGHFSRLTRGRTEPGPSSSSKAPIESTIVDSCETPRFSGANVRRGNGRVAGATALPSAGVREESVTCEQTVTSSPGGSEGSGSAEPSQNPELVYWKRKKRNVDEMEGHSEDIDLESLDTKKEGRSGCASTKRSRAAQVHNLSERRRRDRINEKMKALQELIPRCTKTDKASMLDDAIEYLKSLQLQVQMMTMGCGMVPMMYPASMQQYMRTGTMGMNMMGMCGMNRPPMVPPPYPPAPPPPPLNMSSSSMPSPSPTAAAQMNPTRFPIPPPFPFPVPDPSSRLHASNQSGSVLTPLVACNPNHQQIPNFADPYKQLLGFQQAPVTLPLTQTVEHPVNNKPSSSKDVGNPQS